MSRVEYTQIGRLVVGGEHVVRVHLSRKGVTLSVTQDAIDDGSVSVFTIPTAQCVGPEFIPKVKEEGHIERREPFRSPGPGLCPDTGHRYLVSCTQDRYEPEVGQRCVCGEEAYAGERCNMIPQRVRGMPDPSAAQISRVECYREKGHSGPHVNEVGDFTYGKQQEQAHAEEVR